MPRFAGGSSRHQSLLGLLSQEIKVQAKHGNIFNSTTQTKMIAQGSESRRIKCKPQKSLRASNDKKVFLFCFFPICVKLRVEVGFGEGGDTERLSHRSAPNLHFCSQTTETQEMTLLTLKFRRSAGCFSDSFRHQMIFARRVRSSFNKCT